MAVDFSRLVLEGRIELVNGGLVMPDETVTHYEAVLDQLEEGQSWVKDKFSMLLIFA